MLAADGANTLPCMAGWLDAVIPAASAALGAAAAFGGVWVTQLRQDRREEAARQHERAVAAVKRREDFELEHLIEFNRLLRECERELSGVIYRYTRNKRADEPEEPPVAIGEKASTFMAAAGAVKAQVGFILNDEVRAAAHMGWRTLEVAFGSYFLGVEPDYQKQTEPVEQAFAAIAARAREIYAGREGIEPQ